MEVLVARAPMMVTFETIVVAVVSPAHTCRKGTPGMGQKELFAVRLSAFHNIQSSIFTLHYNIMISAGIYGQCIEADDSDCSTKRRLSYYKVMAFTIQPKRK